MTPGFADLIMRAGLDPHSAPNKPPLPPKAYDRRIEMGMIFEQNVPVRLRDGVIVYLDIHLPLMAGPGSDLPVLLAWGPYGKHGRTNRIFWPLSGVDPEWVSPLTAFEAPDPVYWTQSGYAVANADPRGLWHSEGDFYHNGPIEAEDCREVIYFLSQQPWSNGKVGMSGVSYLACIQYWVAALQPEPLAAIHPCEGFADWYREFAYHGGIPETGFLPRASDNIRYSYGRTEDTLANVRAHPLWDAYWQSKSVALERIQTPAYVVAGWADQGLHTRGTIDAFCAMSSKDKWLEIHGRKKWAHFYDPDNRPRQREFMDAFLKPAPNQFPAWPRVRFELRHRTGQAVERTAENWPLPNTVYHNLYLDAQAGRLTDTMPLIESKAVYEVKTGAAQFDYRFEAATDLIGYIGLKLWIEIDQGNDADLFVILQKLDSAGQPVGFVYYAFYENGPLALGWLRASHRGIDTERSTAFRPIHRHDHEDPVTPGQPTPVEIEVWPQATHFEAGEYLRLTVQGHDFDFGAVPNLPMARHDDTRNGGHHTIHSGGRYGSYLVVPKA
jgi:predicted acyl esterase